jgi:hypothetical protein
MTVVAGMNQAGMNQVPTHLVTPGERLITAGMNQVLTHLITARMGAVEPTSRAALSMRG